MFAFIKIHHRLLSTTLYVLKFIQIQSKNMHFIFAKITKNHDNKRLFKENNQA